MQRKTLVLYNVKAGRGRMRRRIDLVEQLLSEAGFNPTSKLIRFGQNPFEDIEQDINLVVVCGGDGTINYVVNSMRNLNLDYTLAVVPSGTANDFAGALRMSSRIKKAVEQIVTGKERLVDLGRVNDLYFVNVFSFGMFTTTSQHTPDTIKRYMGKAAYLIEGSKELHNREYIPLHIVHDGGELDVNSAITLILNGETAGRFPLARNASVCDGMLDLVLMRKSSLMGEAFAAVKYLVSGNTNEDIIHIRSSKLQISSPLSPLTDVDGQPGPDFPLEIECLPSTLKILAP